jgi:SAM-dependent methyltransferase
MTFRINLGGEGEVLGVLNQQGRWVILDPAWRSSRTGRLFADLVSAGLDFVIADNQTLPFPDDFVDDVLTDSVPLDQNGYYGPGVQTSEIKRILKPGCRWVHEGVVLWVKP